MVVFASRPYASGTSACHAGTGPKLRPGAEFVKFLYVAIINFGDIAPSLCRASGRVPFRTFALSLREGECHDNGTSCPVRIWQAECSMSQPRITRRTSWGRAHADRRAPRVCSSNPVNRPVQRLLFAEPATWVPVDAYTTKSPARPFHEDTTGAAIPGTAHSRCAVNQSLQTEPPRA